MGIGHIARHCHVLGSGGLENHIILNVRSLINEEIIIVMEVTAVRIYPDIVIESSVHPDIIVTILICARGVGEPVGECVYGPKKNLPPDHSIGLCHELEHGDAGRVKVLGIINIDKVIQVEIIMVPVSVIVRVQEITDLTILS